MIKNLLFVFFVLWFACLKANASSVTFIENKGQWGTQPFYKAELPNTYTYFFKNNFTYLIADTADMNRLRHDLHRYYEYKPQIDPTIHLHMLRAVFENSNTDVKVEGENKVSEYFNFYIGKDPQRWTSHVNGFQSLRYKNIYSNIDLIEIQS